MGFAKTAILMAVMTALFLAVGALIGGRGGMMIAFVFAVGMNAFAYWNSGKAVLRMHNARQVDAQSAPEYYALVAGLAKNAGMPMPKVFVIETDQPNAFATGRNPENAAVAATTGLLARLTQEELAGVMAHELAHVKNYDTLTMTITATFAGAISMLANFAMFSGGNDRRGGIIGTIAIMILAPLAAGLVQMAVSRSREYEADRIGAAICGHPMWLAGALQKIEAFASKIENPAAERNPATAHMFIINPLHAFKHDRLFSTHPATASRVAALREIARSMRPTTPLAREAAKPVLPRQGPWG